jgi:thioesterase domain-containing protein
VAELQHRLGRKLDLARLFGGATVESLAAMLRDAHTPASSSPLVALQRRGKRPPLYCVHPIGGSALSFRELARALGDDQPLHVFHARGLEGEAPPFDEIPAMARYYLGALGDTVASHPLWLGGWSFGGLVAYEMARQLEAEGVSVAGLILLDTWLPEMAGAMASVQADQAAAVMHLARELGLEADADTTLEVLAARAVERGLLPPDTASKALARVHAVFEAHHRAFRTYRVTLARRCRVVLVRPEQCLDPEAAAVIGRDPTAGWGALAPGSVELMYVPGDHFRMMRAPHIDAVAAVIRHAMQRSEPFARAEGAPTKEAP